MLAERRTKRVVGGVHVVDGALNAHWSSLRRSCALRGLVLESGFVVGAGGLEVDAEAFGECQEVGEADPEPTPAGDLDRWELAAADPVANRPFALAQRLGYFTDGHQLLKSGPLSHRVHPYRMPPSGFYVIRDIIDADVSEPPRWTTTRVAQGRLDEPPKFASYPPPSRGRRRRAGPHRRVGTRPSGSADISPAARPPPRRCGPPASAEMQTGLLDWRHVDAPRAPTVLERLRRGVATPRTSVRVREVPVAQSRDRQRTCAGCGRGDGGRDRIRVDQRPGTTTSRQS